ncbi:hypothetical protein V1517DRAFT_305999 [Lipomyces orientalis]|uniref:Uncharacterized protein n=1 Tax=Lipomyces orientalis TaxID=1233043 RepID=A0ACC3TTU1_9ASCO
MGVVPASWSLPWSAHDGSGTLGWSDPMLPKVPAVRGALGMRLYNSFISGKAMKNVKNATLRSWGPVGLGKDTAIVSSELDSYLPTGLAVVPALPYLFDEPVEEAVEWVFEQGKAAYKDFNKKDL